MIRRFKAGLSNVLPRPTGIARQLFPAAFRSFFRRHHLRDFPVNFRLRDSSQAAIDADVAYAIQIGRAYLDYFAAEGIDPRGKTLLEVGPGINFGSALLLACHGARPIIADRFLAKWDPDYHPKFYTALRNTLAAHDPAADLTPLNRLVEQNGYGDDSVREIRCSAEDLRGIPDSSVDAIVSNAVLEHLSDLPAACRELGRVSKAHAWGFHQVDFRDHRDFDRPLEYLLLGDGEFRKIFSERHGECGSQWRPSELADFFQAAGFEVLRFDANGFANEDYLREFELRLRTSPSRYREMPIEGLRTLGGLFHVRRQPSHSVSGH